MDGCCQRRRHSFNPAPDSVPRSNLLGVCHRCQAETVIEWHNRQAWADGQTIPGVHLPGCPDANDPVRNIYRKVQS